MEVRARISTPVYGGLCAGVAARIVYENDQLIFFTKREWIGYVFGVLWQAIVPDKERFRINISDVESLTVGQSWTGKLVYTLTLKDNDYCKIFFKNNNELTDILEENLKNKMLAI
ncbi:MAG: hypothetical protein KH354_01845 [Clostridiales bacterium]|nr:hypothetical protein [Clostridiales bacterium]